MDGITLILKKMAIFAENGYFCRKWLFLPKMAIFAENGYFCRKWLSCRKWQFLPKMAIFAENGSKSPKTVMIALIPADL
jgi:uncharacterized protein YqcC (DUF446 family)